MINTKELRRLAQAALTGPDGVSLNWVKLLQDFQEEANPAAIIELLDRLDVVEQDRRILVFTLGKECAAVDAAKSEMMVQARLLNISREREASLMAKLEAAEKVVTEAYQRGYSTGQEEIEKERDELRIELKEIRYEVAVAHDTIKAMRAKIEAMEKQEPVAWRTFDGEGGYDYRSFEDNEDYQEKWNARNPNYLTWVEPLYALPGAKGEEK